MRGAGLLGLVFVVTFSEGAQAQQSMVELSSDLPPSLVQPRSVLPFRVFVKNLSGEHIVLDRLRSLAAPLELDVQFTDIDPRRKVEEAQFARRNVLAAHETRELSGVIRLAPGRLPIQARLDAAVPSPDFLRTRLRPLGADAYCLPDSQKDPRRKPIKANLQTWLEVAPNPEVERLRSQLRVVDFVAGVPHFGLLVRDQQTAYAQSGSQLTPLGKASLEALERLGRAFQGGRPTAIYLAPGALKPGGRLERRFRSDLSAAEPNAPLGAAVRFTQGRPYLRLTASKAAAFFECLRADGLILSQAGPDLVVVSE